MHAWEKMQTIKLCAEDALLSAIVGRRFGYPFQRDAEQIAAGSSSRLVARASYHGLASWLMQDPALLQDCGLPASTVEQLREARNINVLKTLRAAADTLALIRLLASAGIPSMPLKGVALSEILYGNPSVRAAGDLDLLVRPRDVLGAHHALLDAGYHLLEPFKLPSPKALNWWLHCRHHFAYRRQPSAGQYSFMIELHWALDDTPSLLPPMPAWWEPDAPRSPLAGQALPRFPDAYLLAYLMAHGARSGWFKLKWVVDVLSLRHNARALPAPPNEVMEDFGLKALQKQFDHLIHWFFVDQSSSSRRPRSLLYRRPMQLLSDPEKASKQWRTTGELAISLPYEMQFKLSGRYQWDLLQNRILTPTDFEWLPLPARYFWLYYPLRPLLFLMRRWKGRKREHS